MYIFKYAMSYIYEKLPKIYPKTSIDNLSPNTNRSFF